MQKVLQNATEQEHNQATERLPGVGDEQALAALDSEHVGVPVLAGCGPVLGYRIAEQLEQTRGAAQQHPRDATPLRPGAKRAPRPLLAEVAKLGLRAPASATDDPKGPRCTDRGRGGPEAAASRPPGGATQAPLRKVRAAYDAMKRSTRATPAAVTITTVGHALQGPTLTGARVTRMVAAPRAA